MASPTTTSETARSVLVQTTAWGYAPLDREHPGVRDAIRVLTNVSTVDWGLIAEIAQLAGHSAHDLVIVGGPAVNDILREVRDALLVDAIARGRTR